MNVAGKVRDVDVVLNRVANQADALYRFVIAQDEVRVLALRRQRELGFLP